MNIITNIQDFHHGQEVLTYHCRVKEIAEGDQFLTLKPINATTVDSIKNQVEGLLNLYPLSCIGVFEAERSIFLPAIQKYEDRFIPTSFFHCHIVAKNSPEIISFRNAWIDLNKGNRLAINRKEVNNLSGLVSYLSKQINHNPTVTVFSN